MKLKDMQRIFARDWEYVSKRHKSISRIAKKNRIILVVHKGQHRGNKDVAAQFHWKTKLIFFWEIYFKQPVSERRRIIRHEFGHVVFFTKFGTKHPYFVQEVFCDLYAEEPEIMGRKNLSWLKKASPKILKLQKALKLNTRELYYIFEPEVFKFLEKEPKSYLLSLKRQLMYKY